MGTWRVQPGKIGGVSIVKAVMGDITKLQVDAIVNAANSSLLGGGGVDGAIHRAAGASLVLECLKLHGCKAGNAKMTGGYKLPAKHIIHAVGPYWRGGNHGEAEILASCYSRCLEIANKANLTTIAFPCISTGIYGYPSELAADVAIKAVRAGLEVEGSLEEITFCCFLQNDLDIYNRLLK